MKLGLYWSYATRSLLRGGQRSVLAMFCVAVGVMSMVALQLVSLSVNQALLGNVVEANGGDMRVSASISSLRPADLTFFDQLQRQGQVNAYAATLNIGASATAKSGDALPFNLVSASTTYPLVGQPDFIAPARNLTLQTVLNGNNVAVSSRVFQQLGAKLGATYQIKTLDGRVFPVKVAAEFQEGGAFSGPQIIIAQQTLATLPAADGGPFPVRYDTVYLTVPGSQLNSVKQQISQKFPSVRVTTAKDLLHQRQRQVEQIQLYLRIVGLLALFIGGIGIINTMQVLLRRRQVEIAMLKTTGYRRRDLYGLFGLEAALLGIVGGVLGSAAGVGASYLLRVLVEQTFYLHLPVVLDWYTIIAGVVIGLATALIFGLLPIVQASQVRPLAVLRDGHEPAGISSWLTSGLLLALLSLLFVALATTVLGDLVTATIAVYGGFGIIFALALALGGLVLAISKLPVYERPSPRMLLWILSAGGLLLLTFALSVGLGLLATLLNRWLSQGGHGSLGVYVLVVFDSLGLVLLGSAAVFLIAVVIDAVVMFVPRTWKTPVMLAYRNIGRQRVRTTTTLTALFVGVFAIGLVLVLGQGIKDTLNQTLSSLFTRNVFVVVSAQQQAQVSASLGSGQGIDSGKTLVNVVTPQVYPLLIDGRDVNTILHNVHDGKKVDQRDVLGDLGSVQGFDLARGGDNLPAVSLKNGRNLRASDSGTNNVLVNATLEADPLGLRPGNVLLLQSTDGHVVKELTIVGFYNAAQMPSNPNFGAILADRQAALVLGGKTALAVFSLKVDPDHLPALKQHLTKTVPRALVISIADIDALINQVLNNLIVMLTVIASLAMLAGIIIIANAVALAMLERQREIGILKAVGYTSRSVLATVMIENGLVGGIGAMVAMLLVTGSLAVLGQFVFQIHLSLAPAVVALIVATTALVTVLVALLVSWHAVRIRPLEVLRYE